MLKILTGLDSSSVFHDASLLASLAKRSMQLATTQTISLEHRLYDYNRITSVTQ